MTNMKTQQLIAFVFCVILALSSTGVFATSVIDDTHHNQNKIIDPNERDTKPLNLQSDSSSQRQSNQGQNESGSSSQGQNKTGEMSSGSGSYDKDKKSNY